jgi:sterol desaturase/sphingolipid hydroxylase (fatty acid hydroxylase superfamily)
VSAAGGIAAAGLFALPFEAAQVAAASVARNVAAEWLFYATIGAALVLAVAVDLMERRDVLRKWTSKAVRTDALYALTELSHVHALILLVPAAAWLTSAVLERAPWLPIEAVAELPLWAQALIFLVVGDFAQYWIHRWEHASPWLWQFHKVHHSQRELTVLTHFRFPILDRLVSTLLLLPLGFISGSATLPVLLLTLKLFRSALEHSGLPWTYGPLGRIVVSPSFHAVHHSRAPEHMDRNFSGVFAFWDHLFGTYAARGDQPLRYGLVHEEIPECYIRQHWVPLVGLWRLAQARWSPEPAAETST